MTINLLLAISGLILLVLCLGVYLSNPAKTVNKALSAFLLSGLLWVMSNLLTNLSSSPSLALFFARSALIGASLIPLTFLIFAVSYTEEHRLRRRYLALISLLPLVLILMTPTSWNIEKSGPNGNDIQAGPAYLLIIVVLITYFSWGIYKLVRYYKKAPAIKRSQLQYIFAGLVLTAVPALVTNAILPLLGSSGSSAYGPISVVIISVFTTIAIVRHRLLDIRLIVARSLAYILSLGIIALLVSLTLVGLSDAVAKSRLSINIQRIISVLVTVILVLSYPSLKKFFDRISNKLFYRDAYDPQAFLDELNAVLVTHIDLKELLGVSSKTIANNLKAEYCCFVIQRKISGEMRIFGTDRIEISHDETSLINHAFTQSKQKVLLASDLDDKQLKLQTLMQENFIMAISRLVTRTDHMGYVLLGQKKSGNIYSPQDGKIIELISDELAIAIQNALRFEEIQQFNITLQEKIEEATKKLRHANVRLKELDATKDEFISMASHQLRTPLTTIKGYLSMILDGDVGKVKKEEKDLIQHAFDSAERMVYLIADLLNVSRLQTGKFVIENKPTDLAKVLEGEITQLKEQAATRNIMLAYDKPKEFPVLNLDETKVRQVMMNFLDNALYYTPKEGEVTAKLEATPQSVNFTVTDTGVGVPVHVQHHLFTKFYRAENARKMRPDGTGLGLYMAKKVIVAQGGAVIFKSAEGKGSTFGFSFPRKTMEVKA